MAFGGNNPHGVHQRRGKDVVHHLDVTLEELYNGVVRQLDVQRNVICGKCNGYGGKKNAWKRCFKCDGSGVVIEVLQFSIGPSWRSWVVCSKCSGSGEFMNSKNRCRNCKGKKIVQERKVLEVYIDKGMKDGQMTEIVGEGYQEQGVEPGDIIVVLSEKVHKVFKRTGSDLNLKIELTLTEALCGFQRIIQTLDRRSLVIAAMPGKVTKHGSFKYVLNEGMPECRYPFEKGRLVIQFVVQFPVTINPTLIPRLEEALPPRPENFIPDEAEEVTLSDMSPNQGYGYGERSREVYEEDEDERHHGVQCETH